MCSCVWYYFLFTVKIVSNICRNTHLMLEEYIKICVITLFSKGLLIFPIPSHLGNNQRNIRGQDAQRMYFSYL